MFTSLSIFSQQQALFTQYMFNDLIFNPAIAGVKNYVPINLNTRRQWMGVKEAPVTQTLSAHGYMGFNMGLGGTIFNQVTGPTRRTGATLSSAYHLKVKKNKYDKNSKTISFGMAFTLSQYSADKEKLKTRIPDDPTVDLAYNYQLIPDLSAGIYYHNANKYYVGISALNLIQSPVDLLNSDTNNINKVVRNYYVMGGGNIDMSNDISLQPSLLYQMIESKPFQFDATVLASYKRAFFIGISYRHLDAVAGIVGYKNNFFKFGYSYDYTTSELSGFNNGSHEVNLTLYLLKEELAKNRRRRNGDKVRRRRNNEYQPDIYDF